MQAGSQLPEPDLCGRQCPRDLPLKSKTQLPSTAVRAGSGPLSLNREPGDLWRAGRCLTSAEAKSHLGRQSSGLCVEIQLALVVVSYHAYLQRKSLLNASNLCHPLESSPPPRLKHRAPGLTATQNEGHTRNRLCRKETMLWDPRSESNSVFRMSGSVSCTSDVNHSQH